MSADWVYKAPKPKTDAAAASEVAGAGGSGVGVPAGHDVAVAEVGGCNVRDRKADATGGLVGVGGDLGRGDVAVAEVGGCNVRERKADATGGLRDRRDAVAEVGGCNVLVHPAEKANVCPGGPTMGPFDSSPVPFVADMVRRCTSLDLGTYQRPHVSNLPDAPAPRSSDSPSSSDDTSAETRLCSMARSAFDQGLMHLFGFHHEEAAKCFLLCLKLAPDCVLAHGMVSLCHSPNYNFKGKAYYDSTNYSSSEPSVVSGGDGVASEDASAAGKERDHGVANEPLSAGGSSQHGEEKSEKQTEMDGGVSGSGDLGYFPSQQMASHHSYLALRKAERLRKNHGDVIDGDGCSTGSDAITANGIGCGAASSPPPTTTPVPISDLEQKLIEAIRIRTCRPGVDPDRSEKLVGRPYANAMRKIYAQYGHSDPEVSYLFVESLMVLNAWKLFEFPTGRPLSPDVEEVMDVIEDALERYPHHAGLCHLYVHLCEMSSKPGKALRVCDTLTTLFPDAGHLIHMSTHIHVLVGDYDSTVRYNDLAIDADRRTSYQCPDTAGTTAFYFGYIVHNFHMLVYGAILGGFEGKAMDTAAKLNCYLREDLFVENQDLVAYLEAYSAMDIHVMIRFGRWEQLLMVPLPKYPLLMLYRTASLRYGRGLAFAALGDVPNAKLEADMFDNLRLHPESSNRILHNNLISSILAVDAPMLRGEIAYREGLNYDAAFDLLREAVALQDGLVFDEPWGKMQPVRHALGGLLLERGHTSEAEDVFRKDLEFHPHNPFGLNGLIKCLELRLKRYAEVPLDGPATDKLRDELDELYMDFAKQRDSPYADFKILRSCECCGR